MAGTAELITQMERLPGVHYPVLVPNRKGLENLFATLDSSPSPLTDEIAIFTAATDAFTKANLNTSIADSLAQLAPVARAALDRGLRVRGYVSVVISCPYTGQVDYKRVRDVAKALVDMVESESLFPSFSDESVVRDATKSVLVILLEWEDQFKFRKWLKRSRPAYPLTSWRSVCLSAISLANLSSGTCMTFLFQPLD
jgi:hypothetical protein